jgi:hypothetical protein
MPISISTLLTRNLSDVFGENDPVRRRAAIDELYAEDVVFYDPTRSTASPERSRQLTLTFNISLLLSRRNWAMPDGSHGCRVVPVSYHPTPGPISSLRGMDGSQPSIFFSTKNPCCWTLH